MIEFICDSSIEELVVENKVSDIHTALVAMKEPLFVRENFSSIRLNNVAISDPRFAIVLSCSCCLG